MSVLCLNDSTVLGMLHHSYFLSNFHRLLCRISLCRDHSADVPLSVVVVGWEPAGVLRVGEAEALVCDGEQVSENVSESDDQSGMNYACEGECVRE